MFIGHALPVLVYFVSYEIHTSQNYLFAKI
jgi:hypothetical protein